jgi:ubiquinone/menaquinone biosynthesis C-methylase UbiE
VEALHPVADRLAARVNALDVAGGTGDLAAGLLRQVGKEGRVVLSDINPKHAGDRPRPAAGCGFVGNVECIVADAERLPFEDNSFDCVTIGFGCATSPTRPRRCVHAPGAEDRAANCWCWSFRRRWRPG